MFKKTVNCHLYESEIKTACFAASGVLLTLSTTLSNEMRATTYFKISIQSTKFLGTISVISTIFKSNVPKIYQEATSWEQTMWLLRGRRGRGVGERIFPHWKTRQISFFLSKGGAWYIAERAWFSLLALGCCTKIYQNRPTLPPPFKSHMVHPCKRWPQVSLCRSPLKSDMGEKRPPQTAIVECFLCGQQQKIPTAAHEFTKLFTLDCRRNWICSSKGLHYPAFVQPIACMGSILSLKPPWKQSAIHFNAKNSTHIRLKSPN